MFYLSLLLPRTDKWRRHRLSWFGQSFRLDQK
jgi:hypothetical protein